ncbi:MAG: sigma-70 family RNA polymerase sigma factor [Myxococcales bacterium]|nr:sigma-70 family RNA polymerase sigma factor [Myxococcales bacterium]
MAGDELVARFRASVSAARLDEVDAIADLGDRLAALVAAAAIAHPALADGPTLAAAIAIRLGAGAIADQLARVHAADLALAVAASAGDRVAVAAFERAHGPVLDAVARRFAGGDHSVEDLRQIALGHLLVAAPGRGPKLADYAGLGFLDNWLRVTAVRLFLDLGRRKDRAREAPVDDDVVAALAAPGDLALDHLKSEYRGVVAAALQLAARGLEPGDRHLLRQHLAHGMTIDHLAAALGIHRATVARRITRARERMLAAARAELAARLRLPDDELASVIRLAASGFDVSVARLLASAPEPS